MGAVLSSLLAILMIAILVGSVSRLLNQSPINPSSLILYLLVGIFLLAGVLHPREFVCLFPGVLYFVSLPAAFVLLNIYSLCNLNNVSWGTREVARKKVNTKSNIKANDKSSFWSKVFSRQTKHESALLSILDKLDEIEKRLSLSSSTGTFICFVLVKLNLNRFYGG